MRHAVTRPAWETHPVFGWAIAPLSACFPIPAVTRRRPSERHLRERWRQSADRVLTSAWCRCVDTAELMDLGPVEIFEPLNSFFASGDAASQTDGSAEKACRRLGRGREPWFW